MSDIEKLARAATELGNHVAAAVRLSNVLTGILKDGDRDDLDPMTRRVILRAAKAEHDTFRSKHFRGLLDSLNTVVEISDGMWQSEPIGPDDRSGADLAEPPGEPAVAAVSGEPPAVLGDVRIDATGPHASELAEIAETEDAETAP